MEPAVDRREHPARGRVPPLAHKQPQWSPPLIGGSTGHRDDRLVPGQCAAMEPAVDRREHGQDAVAVRVTGQAAMEPAVDRREHGIKLCARAYHKASRNGARR